MDDPTLASHCRLYNAHSLMQIGKLKTASIIIRLVFEPFTINNMVFLFYESRSWIEAGS